MLLSDSIRLHLVAVALLLCCSCAQSVKLTEIRSQELSARLSLPPKSERYVPDMPLDDTPRRDTLAVTGLDGRQVLIMRAIKDDETGEMVATEQLQAAMVTARFRNVAERHGKVDIEFQVIVPERMQDSRWQLRFHPDMFILRDSIRLDDVVITGQDYRKEQLRGYEQYERFLSRIITDTTRLYFMHDLEVFLERNIPQVYAFKTDSSYVSDEQFLSVYGVSEQEAVEHYRKHVLTMVNERRLGRRGKMMDRYVKAPIVTEHIRLDTVMRDVNGDFVYNYVQTITTRPMLRKVDIVLSGEIYEQEKVLYRVPRSEPLTFYISSLSTLVDNREKYRTRVIERSAEENTACYVDFQQGRSNIDETLGRNAEEMGRIRHNLRELLENEIFDIDSIVVSAYSSPEGSEKTNRSLSQSRAAAIADYLDAFIASYRDSLRLEAGFSVDELGNILHEPERRIPFLTRSLGENWRYLDLLVASDSLLTEADRKSYSSICSSSADNDGREALLSREPYYPHLRSELYPRLRTVTFNFYLHRRGMVKDTVHTTEIDTLYMNGVQAIRDRDYESAVKMLATYRDYNTAVAYVALDRNMSALQILEPLEETPQVNYLLAILYSRTGQERKAVERYLRACAADPQLVHRGNLDPEISALIKAFNLNAEPDDNL